MLEVFYIGKFSINPTPVSVEPKAKGNVLLLTTNTEVSVAPKPHPSQKPANGTPSAKENTSVAKYSPENGAQNLYSVVTNNAQILRVLPQRFVQPPFPEEQSQDLIAYVSSFTLFRLYPSHEPSGSTSSVYFRATHSRLSPPPGPSPSSSNPVPPPAPRILNPSTHDGTQGNHEHDLKGGILVGQLESVPDDHIVFPLSPDNLEDWDLIR